MPTVQELINYLSQFDLADGVQLTYDAADAISNREDFVTIEGFFDLWKDGEIH